MHILGVFLNYMHSDVHILDVFAEIMH